MSPVLARRAALPAAAAPVVPHPGCAAGPVKPGLAAALSGWSATSIARGLLARPAALLADRRAMWSGGRVPWPGPARALLDGLEDGCSGANAA